METLVEEYSKQNNLPSPQLLFGKLAERENEFSSSSVDNSFIKSIGWVPNLSIKCGISKLVEELRVPNCAKVL